MPGIQLFVALRLSVPRFFFWTEARHETRDETILIGIFDLILILSGSGCGKVTVYFELDMDTM